MELDIGYNARINGVKESPKEKRLKSINAAYTLAQTIGKGKLGKTKIATHDLTGEKVKEIYLFPSFATIQ